VLRAITDISAFFRAASVRQQAPAMVRPRTPRLFVSCRRYHLISLVLQHRGAGEVPPAVSRIETAGVVEGRVAAFSGRALSEGGLGLEIALDVARLTRGERKRWPVRRSATRDRVAGKPGLTEASRQMSDRQHIKVRVESGVPSAAGTPMFLEGQSLPALPPEVRRIGSRTMESDPRHGSPRGGCASSRVSIPRARTGVWHDRRKRNPLLRSYLMVEKFCFPFDSDDVRGVSLNAFSAKPGYICRPPRPDRQVMTPMHEERCWNYFCRKLASRAAEGPSSIVFG
jgi:hypothetical protein